MKRYILFILLVIPVFLLKSYGQYTVGTAINAGSYSNTFAYSNPLVIYRSENPVYYKFTISSPMTVTLSTCASTLTGSLIVLCNSSGNPLGGGYTCSHGIHSTYTYNNLAAGTYHAMCVVFNTGTLHVKIDGLITIPGNDFSTAFNIGTKSSSFVYTDTRNTNNFRNDYGRFTNDIFYKITLTKTMDVVISHCGSAVSNTCVYVLNSMNTCIASNNGYSGIGACSNTQQAYLKIEDLPPGSYHIISEGYNANGNITTYIEGIEYEDEGDYIDDQEINSGVVSLNHNYLLKVTPTTVISDISNSTVNNSTHTVQYYDGLGRPNETVQIGFSPGKSDLITYQEYDVFGRESNTWLPAVVANNNGSFIPFNTFLNQVGSNYTGESSPYSKSVYEASPLNRLLEQYGPGQAWHNTSRGIKTGYLNNIEGNDTLNCARYNVSYTSSSDTTLNIIRSGNYTSGQLFVTRIVDEDGYTEFEFKDKQGQVVLTRKIIRNGNNKELYDTYYIYDEFGNLSAVLPPVASDLLTGNNSWSNNNDTVNKYAYLYTFDHRNRCKAKKLPGCNWVLQIYDKADQLIFTQDGNQRNKRPQEWTFTIPDIYGRVVLNGICTGTPNVNTINQRFIYAIYPQSGVGSYMGYNIPDYALSGHIILNANYYDNYKFRSLSGFSNSSLSYESSGIDNKYLTRYGLDSSPYHHKGLLTGTATAQLNNSTNPTYLYSVSYYDYRGRLIQTKSTNHLNGGIEKEYVAYNFVGQTLSRMHIHAATGKTTQTEEYSYTYDHAGRPLVTKHRLNSGTEVTLTDNVYDELGRLSSNKRNDHPYLHMNYNYNIRSWVQSISNQHFWENLSYTFGGNINNQQWGQAAKVRNYSFAYDGLSRLTGATYSGDGEYGTNYNYDKHGNIRNLVRYGNTGISTTGIIDSLYLDYNGNQLVKVEDTAPTPSLSSSADFRNGTNVAVEYFYDANGNMIKDLNKGISNIEYNVLNLPRSLSISNASGSATNTYAYAADGRKLSVAKNGFTTDYAGNVIYENGVFKRLLVEGGYYENGMYYFYIQDHLGNNRIVANQDGGVVQSTQYYPYGMVFADRDEIRSLQPYRYNGKEWDNERGLNLYDYSARYMDPSMGRFTTIDPLAEKYYSISPYAYVMNNPIKFIDPDGRDVWEMDHEGKVRWIEESESHVMYALNAEGQRNGNSITLKNRAIFDNLTNTGLKSNYNTSYSWGDPSELASVFLFGADNSNAEWRFSRFNVGDGDKYAVGTVHKDDLAISPEQMGYDRESEISLIHSHPGRFMTVEGRFGELATMGWKPGSITKPSDSWNVYNSSNNYPNYNYSYVYFPYSSNIYHVRGIQSPALIRNIQNHNYNGQRLFWGTLNGK